MTKAPIALADLGDILTPSDVQFILGIGRNATYELLASGRLQSVRITPRRSMARSRCPTPRRNARVASF